MVKGLELFRDHFSAFGDRYILIGGTACDLLMTDAGLEFRATRDLDIVLCIEALDRDFAVRFWSFVEAGGYRRKEASAERRQHYRFQDPTDGGYPDMLELFSRLPDSLSFSGAGALTPIPIDDEVSSLSAILLDEEYDRWIHAGKIELEGVPVVRAEHLIPLKARAWLDLRERRDAGAMIDSRSIRKHRNDIFRLAQIIDPEHTAAAPESIGYDMRRFMDEVAREPPDLKALGIRSVSLERSFAVLNAVYLRG